MNHINFYMNYFTILIFFKIKKLKFKEAKAQGNVKNDYNAICLINADIEVDFAPPLDYVESIPL